MFCQNARPHHLLRRYAIDALTVDPHELLSTSGDYVRLETVCPQIIHDLDHQLIDKLREWPMPLWILRIVEPMLYNLEEIQGAHTSASGISPFAAALAP